MTVSSSPLPTNPTHQQAMADAATMLFRLAALAQETGTALASLASIAALADHDTDFPPPNLPPLPPDSSVPPPEGATVTLAQITAMISRLIQTPATKPAIRALLEEHGVKKAGDLPTETYDAVMSRLTQIEKEIADA
jgi:hypothetical protein